MKCRIKNFNIAFFAIIMGFAGGTILLEKIEDIFNIGFSYSSYLLYFSLFLFTLVLFFYLIKGIINFGSVKKDFVHSVKSNFFPGISKIILLFSIAFLSIDMFVSKVFWIVGAILQLIFTLIILRRWILHENEIKTMNPLWFLPIVGNIIVPIAGVQHFNSEISWFFFSIGFVLWVVMFSLIMNRIIFHNPMAQKLMPSLFILMAPPAIGFISYIKLVGEVDVFARILYYISLFMFLLLLTKINVFRKVKFFLSSWAYSFPLAALTIATFLFYIKTEFIFFKYLGLILSICFLVLVLVLIYKTIQAISLKKICVEED